MRREMPTASDNLVKACRAFERAHGPDALVQALAGVIESAVARTGNPELEAAMNTAMGARVQ